MNVDKILDRKYQMTDAGKIDTIRELYTVFSPNVNLEALKKSDFFPALEQMMEPVLDVPDERSPQVMAYWAKRGMGPATIFFWWKDGALCRRRPGANGSSSFRRWNWMNLCLIF